MTTKIHYPTLIALTTLLLGLCSYKLLANNINQEPKETKQNLLISKPKQLANKTEKSPKMLSSVSWSTNKDSGYQALNQTILQLDESIQVLYLKINNISHRGKMLYVNSYAEQAEGYTKGDKLYSSSGYLAKNKKRTFAIQSKSGQFSIGKYRLSISTLDQGKRRTHLFYFSVKSKHESSQLISSATKYTHRAAQTNLAHKLLGGKLESYSSQWDKNKWQAQNLNDGSPFTAIWKYNRTCSSCGWRSKNNVAYPQDLVFSFYKNRVAEINSIIIDTRTWSTIKKTKGIPKNIEIWVSQSKGITDFKKIKTIRIQNIATEQLITFPARQARYVKIRILDVHNSRYIQIGEIKILETNPNQKNRNGNKKSIIEDYPINLANSSWGTHLLRYTSDSKQNSIAQLFDGLTSTKTGWASANSELGKANYLPQEFVFGFKQQQKVYIKQIQLNLESGPRYHTVKDKSKFWPKKIGVYVSDLSSPASYQQVAILEPLKKAGLQYFNVNLHTRHLKLKILENHGGKITSIGEIKLIEGQKDNYFSITLENRKSDVPINALIKKHKHQQFNAIQADLTEKESNNAAKEANPLNFDQSLKGEIKPVNDQDFFKFTIGQKSGQTLTTQLSGFPFIATSLTLLNEDLKVLKQFDPSQLSKQKAKLSFRLPAGNYFLKIKSEPASLVVICDTSGSMQGQTKQLEAAVHKFINQLDDKTQVNLIRFSNRQTEVLLKDFTSNKVALRAAIKNKFYNRGGTPLYDAIKTGATLLKDKLGNRAIVVLTDGADSESKLKHPAFWRYMDQNRIRIYTIGLGLDLNRFLPEYQSTGKQIMRQIAASSGAKSYFTRDPEQLKKIYQTIANELSHAPTYVLKPKLSTGQGSLRLIATGEKIPAVAAPAYVELVLDASGSMRRRLGKKRMINIAKKVLRDVVKQLPDNVKVAFRTYGNRIREGRKGDCRDSKLQVGFSNKNRKRLLQKINSIRALGTTPIAYSISQLKRDFRGIKQPKLVILVTDGKEECKGNPEKEMKKLQKAGIKLKMNIVGFALKDKKLLVDMHRLAKLSGGQFFNATNSASLKQSLSNAMSVSYQVLDSSNTKIAEGYLNSTPIQLDEGNYTVHLQSKIKKLKIENVKITTKKMTTIELKKEGQAIGIKVLNK